MWLVSRQPSAFHTILPKFLPTLAGQTLPTRSRFQMSRCQREPMTTGACTSQLTHPHICLARLFGLKTSVQVSSHCTSSTSHCTTVYNCVCSILHVCQVKHFVSKKKIICNHLPEECVLLKRYCLIIINIYS